MQSARLTIVNQLGLHARAAAKLVDTASRFKSEILLKRGSREANGKSIMGVMMLAAGKGTEVMLEVNGQDETEAFQALRDLIVNRFGEAQ